MGREPSKSPDRPRRAGTLRKQDDARRARLYLEQLTWLRGAPEGAGWRRFDSDDVIALDGARISTARRAARTAIREHPIGLAAEVGDVDRWWAAIDAKLAWLSALAADRPATFDVRPHLPTRLARVLDTLQRGALRGVATAAAIAWVADPDRLARVLDYVVAHPELAQLAGIDDFDRLARVLVQLAVTGDAGKARAVREAGVAALIAALALDAPHPQFALDRTRNVEATLLGQTHAAAIDAGRTRPKLVAWTYRIARLETPVRQRALALWAVAGIPEAFAPWQRWEQAEEPLIKRATELATTSWDAWDRANHVAKVIGNLVLCRKRAPEPVALGDLLLEIDMLASEPMIRFHASIVRLLAAIPAAMPVHTRPRMVLHLARAAASAGSEERVDWLWDELAAALERAPSPALLDPWAAAIASPWRNWIDSDLVEGVKRRGDLTRLIRTLAKLAANDKLPADYPQRTASWIAAGLAEDVAVDVVRAFDKRFPVHELELSRLAIALSDGTAADLIPVAAALHELADDMRYYPAQHLVTFGEQMAKLGAGWLVRGALLGKQGTRLVETATLVTSISKNTAAWPKLLSPPAAWIARYPSSLEPSLRRLASVDPDAEDTAARRLGDDLPDPRALEREIAALRASGRAPKRLANLEARLAAPKQPSPKRLANLADRLELTAREIAFTRMSKEATAISGARVIKTFALAGWPAWADPPDRAVATKLREVLFALVDLDAPADRELAGKLLRARSGPPPWDLRDEPANAAFLAGMRKAGIDPAPWLDDTATIVKLDDGEPISLALTSDPLEVFQMGAHFETCLSPGGGKFFSVVANAADINKRVLYARSREGNVVGRCLFALTEGYALLVFQQYCHRAIDFSAMVRDFATALARRMGTQLVARGPVRTLLARDWYDDGARDLVGRFEGLAEDFDLSSIAPEALIATLRTTLQRELDDVTLPIVLGHRSLRGQPRHLAPLVPYVLASHAPQTRIDAAQLAFDNGDRALADRLLGEHDRAIRIDDHAWPRGELVGYLRPSVTLARLRQSRPRHVRSWADDRADRIALAGVALEALARPRQAAAMYRLAAKTEAWIEESMSEKLDKLGAPRDGEIAG